jgi:hypothetical protein
VVWRAGRKETSPFSTEPVSLDVDALLGQQPQSKHAPAQSPNGSSEEVEQVGERPKTADTMKVSNRIAAKVAPRRRTQALITLAVERLFPLARETSESRTARLSLGLSERRAGRPT